jgi:hypothetical protein
VFKAMLAVCEKPSSSQAELRLTDPDFETANELDVALSAIGCFNKNDNSFAHAIEDGCRLGVNAVIFAKKYEMNSVLTTITLYLYKLVAQYPPAGGGNTYWWLPSLGIGGYVEG